MSQWGKATVDPKQTYPNSSPSAKYISRFACNYIQFRPSSNTTKTLTVTVNFAGTTSGTVAKLQSVRETLGGSSYITARVITSNTCTIVQNNFGSAYNYYLTIVPINASNTGTVTYTWSASIS